MNRRSFGNSRGGNRSGGKGRGRSGGGGGGRGRSRGGRRSSGGRNGYGRSRDSSASGNKRERISIESGNLVVIDQFMLANPQFLDQLSNIIDEAPEKKDDLVRHFGGEVVEVEPGTYRIERDPFGCSIVVHPDEYQVESDKLESIRENEQGVVFIDTRCLAMIDRELLDDNVLLEKYQQLWFAGDEKACRDLLRDNGGAVRYGFNRTGDELSLYYSSSENLLLLKPNGEEVVAEAQSDAVEASEMSNGV